jgi:hypothetical protein
MLRLDLVQGSAESRVHFFSPYAAKFHQLIDHLGDDMEMAPCNQALRDAQGFGDRPLLFRNQAPQAGGQADGCSSRLHGII